MMNPKLITHFVEALSFVTSEEYNTTFDLEDFSAKDQARLKTIMITALSIAYSSSSAGVALSSFSTDDAYSAGMALMGYDSTFTSKQHFSIHKKIKMGMIYKCAGVWYLDTCKIGKGYL